MSCITWHAANLGPCNHRVEDQFLSNEKHHAYLPLRSLSVQGPIGPNGVPAVLGGLCFFFDQALLFIQCPLMRLAHLHQGQAWTQSATDGVHHPCFPAFDASILPGKRRFSKGFYHLLSSISVYYSLLSIRSKTQCLTRA